jgi:hypothetical protein
MSTRCPHIDLPKIASMYLSPYKRRLFPMLGRLLTLIVSISKQLNFFSTKKLFTNNEAKMLAVPLLFSESKL